MAAQSQCTIHLVSLTLKKPDDLASIITQCQTNDLCGPLIRGVPYGWVHKPHNLNATTLLSKNWDLFFLTERDDLFFGGYVASFVDTHLSIPVALPQDQVDALKARMQRGGIWGFAEDDRPKPNPKTPALPSSWYSDSQKKEGEIPVEAIVESKADGLRQGELYLDSKMAEYLSTAEPEGVRGNPVCFFNLFKYANGDRSTHDSYMNGFKERFGPDAGAEIKFMGPVKGQLQGDLDSEEQWDDTNLVQYDSVWHYAYMLSTDVYQELNEEKMRGLEDTCILMVSEVGWQNMITTPPGVIEVL